jgi:hypothetical protein
MHAGQVPSAFEDHAARGAAIHRNIEYVFQPAILPLTVTGPTCEALLPSLPIAAFPRRVLLATLLDKCG